MCVCVCVKMGRAPCCEKVGLKRGRWTAEEDEILINYIKKNGEGSWRSLPKNAGLLRCGKSCRLRWINYLRADLKRGNFSLEEEDTIIKLHRSVGNRWSLIASHLPGRTDNEVKNYWNSHLSRKIFSFRSSHGNNLMSTIDFLKMANTSKRRGGRVSRSVAKKYNKSITPTTTTTNRIVQNGTPEEHTAATENVKVVVGPATDDTAEHDSCSDRKEDCHLRRRPDAAAAANDMGGVIEVRGGPPFEEPDHDVTAAVLDQFFLSELSDLCKITINTSSSSEEKANGPMAPETCRLVVSEDGNSGAWHSISSSDSGLLQACFSPFNSHFEDVVMAKLDMSDASMGFGLWD